jgi:hypothetical protein
MAMPRFYLRTLIVVMLLGGPALAGAWWLWDRLYPANSDLQHYYDGPPRQEIEYPLGRPWFDEPELKDD